jgi:hypothetical protein
MSDSPTGWRKIVLKAFGFGAGFTLVLIAVVGFLFWYSTKPRPPQPWNSHAVTAAYEFVSTDKEKNQLVFVYTIQNNTNEDYRLSDGSEVDIFERLISEKSIYLTLGERPTIRCPCQWKDHSCD